MRALHRQHGERDVLGVMMLAVEVEFRRAGEGGLEEAHEFQRHLAAGLEVDAEGREDSPA